MVTDSGANGERDHTKTLQAGRGLEEGFSENRMLRHEVDNLSSYSITRRWRERSERWKKWQDGLTNDTLDDAKNLNNLELPTCEYLSMEINGDSPLGQKLEEFYQYTVLFKGCIAGLNGEINLLENDTLENDTLENDTMGPAKSRPREHTADLIQANRQLIKSNTEEFKAMSNNVLMFIKRIQGKHDGIRDLLSFIQILGNEIVTTQPGSHLTLDSTRVDMTAAPSPSGLDMLRRPEINLNLTTQLIGLVGENEKLILRAFHEFVVGLLDEATESEDSKMVKATTNAVLSWNEGKFVRKQNVYYARPPTTQGSETKVDHPILHAVICRIIGILAGRSTDTSVLHEHGATKDQYVAAAAKMSSRRVDISAPHPEYMAVVLPRIIVPPIEIKTAPFGKAKFKKAIETGRSQMFGHLGKRVMCAFDFGGVGHDACVIGVSLTYLSIEVVKVSLMHVGTPNVALAHSTTGCTPLLGRSMMSDGQKAALGLVGDEAALDAKDNANGFLLLAGALQYKSLQEDLPDIKNPDASRVGVRSYLGSGAFSNVYELEQDGYFLKVPIGACLARYLEQEASILKTLQMGQSCPFIPWCDSGVSEFKSTIRGEISLVSGLRLRGVVGVPLHRLLRFQVHCCGDCQCSRFCSRQVDLSFGCSTWEYNCRYCRKRRMQCNALGLGVRR
jgi:hypothetical protein